MYLKGFFFLRAIALELCHGCHDSRKQMEGICPGAEKTYRIWTQWGSLVIYGFIQDTNAKVRWEKHTPASDVGLYSVLK